MVKNRPRNTCHWCSALCTRTERWWPWGSSFCCQVHRQQTLRVAEMLKVKAALQRDLGRLEKWPDRNHTGSSKGRYRALPKDRQTPGTKTSWERVLQKRPWGTKSFHQFGATARLLLPCSAAGAITRVGGEVTSTVACAAATAISSGLVSAACLPQKPGQALGRVPVWGEGGRDPAQLITG